MTVMPGFSLLRLIPMQNHRGIPPLFLYGSQGNVFLWIFPMQQTIFPATPNQVVYLRKTTLM